VPEVVVIDLETTGLDEYDRIIEVAGVVYDTDSEEVVGEFETLVNPLRSITTGTSLNSHQLNASQISGAPIFSEVGPWLAKVLHRRPLIHYSNGFDNRMLNQEFIRTEIDFRVLQHASVKRTTLGLREMAETVGHSLTNHHSALADARAALAVAKSIGWDDVLAYAGRNEHLASDVRVTSHRTLSRFQAGLTETFDLVRLSRGNEFRDLSSEDEYLFLLDELLEDMQLSEGELQRLDSLATTRGISAEQRFLLHERYLADIETAVLRDGHVSEGEMLLVSTFAEILGVKPAITVSNSGKVKLEQGSLISTTSTAVIEGQELSQESLGRIVTDLGFNFTTEFRKKDSPRLLLIPNDGHISTKTKQAIQWGVPQMSVENFLNKFA